MAPATERYLARRQPGSRFAVGGPAALADDAAERIAGADRYQTAAMVTARFFDAPTFAGIANGERFPDALSGGVAAARNGGPLLLTPGTSLSAAAGDYVAQRAGDIRVVHLFGGPAALSAQVHDDLIRRVSAP
jgi:hypothetical protein